jgi:hypothetical protein
MVRRKAADEIEVFSLLFPRFAMHSFLESWLQSAYPDYLALQGDFFLGEKPLTQRCHSNR